MIRTTIVTCTLNFFLQYGFIFVLSRDALTFVGSRRTGRLRVAGVRIHGRS